MNRLDRNKQKYQSTVAELAPGTFSNSFLSPEMACNQSQDKNKLHMSQSCESSRIDCFSLLARQCWMFQLWFSSSVAYKSIEHAHLALFDHMGLRLFEDRLTTHRHKPRTPTKMPNIRKLVIETLIQTGQ